jgi:methionyl-tRNA formyltransferase
MVRGYEEIPSGTDISFFLGCTRVALPEHLALSKHNIVVHQSALPRGRGWSPLAWQVLEGKNEIPVTVIEAAPRVDGGVVYFRDVIRLEGHELCDELRAHQGRNAIAMCLRVIDAFPDLHGERQTGEPTYYPRRTKEDSRLDPSRTIASQFELLRIVDNDQYPAFFETRGYRYSVQITKSDSREDIVE